MADSQSRLKLVTTHLGGAPATSLAEKVCIITGTNSTIGIGAATAKLFCARGAKAVYLCDYESSNLEDLKAHLGQKYPGTDVVIREFRMRRSEEGRFADVETRTAAAPFAITEDQRGDRAFEMAKV